jgi:PIN domain nuclease of toxin-antitoxin system
VKLLLDTHAVLWWLAEDARLGPAARELIADPANDVLVSAASLWEIVVKQRVGKLQADIGEICRAIAAQGIPVLEIGVAHLATLSVLPAHHRDPFDHLLIAQAICEGAVFLSADANVAAYPVRVMSCAA